MDDSNQMSLALDLILKTIIKMNPPEFGTSETKNWEAISRLIPGSSPSQVERRYNELQLLSWSVSDLHQTPVLRSGVPLTSSTSSTSKLVKTDSADSIAEKSVSRPLSKIQTSSSDISLNKSTSKTTNRSDHGPTMVIHVCDEAKNLKQDFQCPRELLISEMKYFAEYLSTDAQRWEEVDISVHCDVLIFDWLMKFVKRGTKESPTPPGLEANNVVSILISSDFLKMDALVKKCVEYCHSNMNAILATPCNMNCINDKLVQRIAALFNHNELDEIKDRKDKFRNKLFCIKTEALFYDVPNPDSPENATTLFKCAMCKSLLTKNTVSKIRCTQNRMTIDRHGELVYSHIRDTNWDINEWVLNMKADLKNWRDVYWRIWGTINYLDCSRCCLTFPCREFTHCRYHSEAARFLMKDSDGQPSVEGIYPCCGCKTLRFDPSEPIDGCRTRDHVISLPSRDQNQPIADQNLAAKYKVCDDLLLHRDAICIPFVNQFLFEEHELDIFANEEYACGLRDTSIGLSYRKERNRILYQKTRSKKSDQTKQESKTSAAEVTSQPRLQPLMVEKELISGGSEDEHGCGESDDEIGDDEPARFRARSKPRSLKITVDPQAILTDGPDFGPGKKHKWDTSKAVRWNQDAQREEDHIRMNEIVNYLVKLRLNPQKWEKLKQKEYAGGIFSRLEAQWKAHNPPPPKPNALSKINAKPRQYRGSIS